MTQALLTKDTLTDADIKKLSDLYDNNLCMAFEPNGKQLEFVKLVGSGKYFVNVFSAANGVGKSSVLINILINLLYKVNLNDYFNTDFYTQFKHPIKARIASDPTTVESKIIPELKKWLPAGTYTALKSRKAYEYKWKFQGGSTLDILTYDQDNKEFESVDLDVVLLDEPPSREKFTASVSRLRQGGLVIIVMTPLTEAEWIFDRLSNPFGKEKWGVVYADIEDNCKQCGKGGILEHSDIERMVAEYDPDEREARAHGKFIGLSGVIYKQFNSQVHCIKRCRIPKEWKLGLTVDPHPAKSFAMGWWAVTPRNEIIFIEEFPKEDFEDLKRVSWTMRDYVNYIKEIENDLPSEVIYRYIDPNYARSPDVIQSKTVIEEFADHNFFFDADIDDNIEEGILAVKNRLRYDRDKPVSGSNQPTLFFFEDLYNHIKHMSRWGYKEWKYSQGRSLSERAQDKYKDFCDCVRYTVQKDPIFSMPQGGGYKHYKVGYRRRK